jgi:CRP-like cAMP-binding protein
VCPNCQPNRPTRGISTSRQMPSGQINPEKKANSARTKAGEKSDFESFAPLGTKVGIGELLRFQKNQQIVLRQDDPAHAVFYVRKGKVKLTVGVKQGREATIDVLGERDFFAGQVLCVGIATAVTDCTILRLEGIALDQARGRNRVPRRKKALNSRPLLA